MTGLAIGSMVVICGTVWGGFAVLVLRAVRCESVKVRASGPPPPHSGPMPEQG